MRSLYTNFSAMGRRCSKGMGGNRFTSSFIGLVVLRLAELRGTARSISLHMGLLQAMETPRSHFPAYAIVVSRALSACRESRRVCCTTMGTSETITLE